MVLVDHLWNPQDHILYCVFSCYSMHSTYVMLDHYSCETMENIMVIISVLWCAIWCTTDLLSSPKSPTSRLSRTRCQCHCWD
uniref:Uncharacterized protein n=1 Tax=Rhizophora mucronata TaxID=61149 RepID=A0A2P2IR22_RHIMU